MAVVVGWQHCWQKSGQIMSKGITSMNQQCKKLSKRSSRTSTPCLALRRNTLGLTLTLGKKNEAMKKQKMLCAALVGFRKRIPSMVEHFRCKAKLCCIPAAIFNFLCVVAKVCQENEPRLSMPRTLTANLWVVLVDPVGGFGIGRRSVPRSRVGARNKIFNNEGITKKE